MGTSGLVAAAYVVAALLPPTGPILEWLGREWAVTFVAAACAFALYAARRGQRASLAAATSWLAPVSGPGPVRLEVLGGTAAWLAAVVVLAALVRVFGAIDGLAFGRLAFAAAAGALVGLLAGWRLPRAGIGAPGFHYAIVRRTRSRWASAPSLTPLACWPAAQGRIFSRPKKTTPILLIAMMAIPAGTHGAPGQVALAVAGCCMALFSVLSLSAAAVQASFGAARWLAPTTLGRWRFTGALMWRPVLTQSLTLTLLVLLAAVVDRRWALSLGVPLTSAYLCASVAAVSLSSFQACRRVGLGARGWGA